MPGIILGVDPGAHGALAFLSTNGAILTIEDMPTLTVQVGKTKRTRIVAAEIANVLRDYTIRHAFVESVGAMPGQGLSSTFSFGKAAGIVEGVLAALGIPVTFVTPQVWKKTAGLSADKDHSRRRAMELWPENSELFMKVKNADRAEAALIAWHGLASPDGMRFCDERSVA